MLGRLLCRLGWHGGAEWQSFMETGYTYIYHRQRKICPRCSYEEVRPVYESTRLEHD